MKKFITIFLFLIIGMVAFAQQNYQDVVYLKNGSIIRGTIIEQVPNVSLKIETADKSVMVYKMDEIEKISKELIQNVSGTSNKSSGLKSGYLGILNVGYGFGVGHDSKGIDFGKFDFINGYQFNPYFSLGFGTGLKFYFDESNTSLVIPLFADFRAHFIDYMVSPYVAVGIGYTLEATPEFRGLGFMLNPSLGASIKISKRSALNIGVGYLMQRSEGGSLNSINLDFGISF